MLLIHRRAKGHGKVSPFHIYRVAQAGIFTFISLILIVIIVGCVPAKTTVIIPHTTPNTQQSPTSQRAVVSQTSTPPSKSSTVVMDINLTGGAPFIPFTEQSYYVLNRLVLPAIYAELVRMDSKGNYIPYLAMSVPSMDNGLVRFVGQGDSEHLEVEFRLRSNLHWQDGQSLTADDLSFSWNLAMDPDWPGLHYGQIRPAAAEVYVDSVEALAPDRVMYRFMSESEAREVSRTGGRLGNSELYADLAKQVGPVVPLDYLDVGRNVFPKHILQDIPTKSIAKSNFARRPVYAGAYQLVEGGGPDQSVVLEAFDGFALGKPSIERIEFGLPEGGTPYWETPDALAPLLEAGTIQAQLALPAVASLEGKIDPSAYDKLANQGHAVVQWVPRDGWEVLDFNLDNPHLTDLRVRQAIAYAIDRQAIIDMALGGHGKLMRSYFPSWHPLYAGDSVLPDYSYDPEKGRALLREAGYNLSETPAVHPTRGPLILQFASMDVTAYPRQPIAALIQAQLAEIGIQVDVTFYSWPEFEGKDCTAIRNGRHFDLGMAGWLHSPTLYPIDFLDESTSSAGIPTADNGCPLGKSNWSGWRNAQADAILAKLKDGRLALEQPEQYHLLWAEHQRLWASELPSLPLFNWERPVTYVPALRGLNPSPFAFGAVEDTWNVFEWYLASGQ
jgi:ABC-type transport system substrate-binding protein